MTGHIAAARAHALFSSARDHTGAHLQALGVSISAGVSGAAHLVGTEGGVADDVGLVCRHRLRVLVPVPRPARTNKHDLA